MDDERFIVPNARVVWIPNSVSSLFKEQRINEKHEGNYDGQRKPNEIKVGDIVVLMSGSPRMTVVVFDTVRGQVEAKCQWYYGPRQINTYVPVGGLRKATDKELCLAISK